MRSLTLSGLILGLLLFCGGGALRASEADELRERAKAMRKEAAVLAERGNKEQAERLEKKTVRLLEAAEHLEWKTKGNEEQTKRHAEQEYRPGTDQQARSLKERLLDLLAQEKKLTQDDAPENALAEVRGQIVKTERELHAIGKQHVGRGELPTELRPHAEKLEAATRRIHHFRIAAQNLKLAEAHDLAHQLMEKAEAMERDVHQGKKRLAAEMQRDHGSEHVPHAVRELHAEVERLRAELKELRQQLDKR